MSKQLKFEIGVGLLVLIALISTVFIALKVSNFSGFQERSSYQVDALFSNIGGLTARAPVKVSGVLIGRVDRIELDPVSYRARVVMDIYSEFDDIPMDSSVSILTSGLLGSQYIGLEVGGDDMVLQAGDRIHFTQSALVLENLIGRLMVSLTEGGRE
ncbi:outer membrane lipid asymmetry maintenance protein MlaD [Thiomicrospira sp. ALE5]|uniref:outer membrane lipid asymmetry maintenance protein MlaD n=1 Tax=Thiomicrospira sp. ALE5 TaxID=748650 RepID=UPI0008F42214|nr:outer membrane lipid asymmetry maintenance protein MlaD [Thiomicrospira sp. ALE5]SFR59796.1 phospholipid/cholesterol/gamma-HCH transport system substrate-binding protein [Thiomicrospira sp. ALE5]